MKRDSEAMKLRTAKFALRTLKLCRSLPRTDEGRILGSQLLRSATSIGANYRAACRGRSRAEFIAKLGIVLEGADETAFWLELIQEANIFRQQNCSTSPKRRKNSSPSSLVPYGPRGDYLCNLTFNL